MGETNLKIGEIAKLAGVSAKAIRFYEAKGLIPQAPRAENGYRVCSRDTVALLRFIKQAQGVGFTLQEIKDIITIRQGGCPPCAHVYRLLQRKSAELDRKFKDLLMLRKRVRQSLAAWGRAPRGRSAVCPHLEGG